MRYWIIDPFFQAGAEEIAAAFNDVGDAYWYAQHHAHSQKYSCRTLLNMPRLLRQTLYDLNADHSIYMLERRTGISPVFPDDNFYGGGLHQSRPGGFLDLHADFQIHPERDMRRCLNLLIYLSPDWEPSWGGHLELWDDRCRRRIDKIEPRFNRAVLFETTRTSFHGHPEPMGGPPHARRNSLALYYYTPWKDGEKAGALTTTDYRGRPGEYKKRLRKWGGRVLRRWHLK